MYLVRKPCMPCDHIVSIHSIQTFGYSEGNLICFPVSHVYFFLRLGGHTMWWIQTFGQWGQFNIFPSISRLFLRSVRWATSRSGSRHSAGGSQFNMFPSMSRLFVRRRRPNSTAKLDGDHGRICL